VPFTFLALYVRDASAKTLFGALAVLALLVAAYRVWKKERLELLTEFQENSDAERQRREVEMQTAREQLVKLERENRQAAALRELEMRDEQVFECVKRQFEYLTNRGMRPGSMAIAFTDDPTRRALSNSIEQAFFRRNLADE
jgi:3-mercaptopyruvate sulfurtransferase SseA